MKYIVIEHITDLHPYEIIRIKLQAENEQEKNSIMNLDQSVQDYLTMNHEVVEIIEDQAPEFLVKKVKKNIGFGD